MRSATKSLTGAVRVTCGCIGDVREDGTNLTGQYPVVSVRIVVPCEQGHPGRVGIGVTERFVPNVVAPVDLHSAGER